MPERVANRFTARIVAASVAMLALAPSHIGVASAAEKLTAIVQSIAAPSLSLHAFDLLAAGTKIKLQPGETIEIGYFESCVVDRITGGEFVVNERESWVVDGTIDRSKTDCANGGPAMQGAEADAAVVVVRNSTSGKARLVAGKPLLLAPGLKGKTTARIERPNSSDAPIDVELSDGIADLTELAVPLVPGVEYKVNIGNRSARFQLVDKPGAAEAGALSRLILF